jgi:hypothetical protein
MAENRALLQLYPIFAAHFQAIPEDHQQWLLFFALPSALSRHVDSGNKPVAKTLQVLRCQHQTVTATTSLDASIGTLSMKLSLHPSSDDVANGWAVFLAPDVDQFDFEAEVAAAQGRNVSKGIGKKGKKGPETKRFKPPAGVILGLQPGDLVSFDISWPGIDGII